MIVSIRALTRRATSLFSRLKVPYCGFNSCPHAEGNGDNFEIIPIRNVSIRALTRRATVVALFAGDGVGVSIRALTRRATYYRRIHGTAPSFQFVPSRGGQHRCGYTFSTPAFCFNSCPHAEGNLIVKPVFNHSDSFNSCPHAEGNSISRCICSES